MAGRCGDKPTAASFLELFRLLTMYYTTKQVLRGSNCDSEEKNEVLSSYGESIKKRFKENKKKTEEKKKYFRDILLKGIIREIEICGSAVNDDHESPSSESPKIDVLDSDIIYYICGYMVHSFRKKGKKTKSSFCQHCLATVNINPEDLPPNFTASQLTEIKKRGSLIFSSYKLFQLICQVEDAFLKLAKCERVFLKDSYEAVLRIISGKKLPLVGCEIHQKSLMTDVIFQYLTLRFRCYAKIKFVDHVEKKRGEAHARMKMKKLRNLARR